MTAFGPILLSKVLGLNETQESSLGLVFHYADLKGLPLRLPLRPPQLRPSRPPPLLPRSPIRWSTRSRRGTRSRAPRWSSAA
jgi:hypothetical protein